MTITDITPRIEARDGVTTGISAADRARTVAVAIDALQPAKASCGMSSFVAESSIDTVVTGTGEATESRHFQDLSEAITFARDFYAVYAPIIFGFIDVILDGPLRAGGTGWDKIKQMAKK